MNLKQEYNLTYSEKSKIESYAEYMGKTVEQIVTEYEKYRKGDGELDHDDRSIEHWVDARAEIDDAAQCDSCDKFEAKTLLYSYDGERICESCERHDLMEPQATVKHSDVSRPLRIGHYRNESTEELRHGFKAEWVSTSAWRGYTTIKPKGDWEKVDSDTVLMSRNERSVEENDQLLRDIAADFNVEWARVTARTSNVCSTTWDFYIRGPEKEEFLERVQEVRE